MMIHRFTMNVDVLTFGPIRYWVPVCIRGPHGFYGGPSGYHEVATRAEAEAREPITLEPGKPFSLEEQAT